MLKGIKVILIDKVQVGSDDFGQPLLEDREIEVDNVLIAPSSSDDIINGQSLYGKKAIYTLAIPKEDTNVWEDREVMFFGKKWKVFGMSIQGLEHLIPLKWNKKVMVELYEF